jgi:hypothetical protein
MHACMFFGFEILFSSLSYLKEEMVAHPDVWGPGSLLHLPGRMDASGRFCAHEKLYPQQSETHSVCECGS